MRDVHGALAVLQVLDRIARKLGHLYFFDYKHPEGHYTLGMENDFERQLGTKLMILQVLRFCRTSRLVLAHSSGV